MTQALVKEPTAREPLDHRVVMSGNWDKFKLMQQVAEDSPGLKLAYFAGAIEILMPGFRHENFAEIIGYLVSTALMMAGVRFQPSGSMTQERDGVASAQADKSFCLGEAKAIPDLSIEVVYTSGGAEKLPRYEALAVPEVWFWEDGVLKLYHLRAEGYAVVERSELPGLEGLDVELLQRCILMGETDLAEAVRMLQAGGV